METFSSMPALTSGASPGDAMGMNPAALNSNGLGIDGFDSEIAFDESMLENVNAGMSAIPFTPSYDFETFSTTFEDPFHYSRAYEPAPDAENYNDEDSSPRNVDDKLLSFSATVAKSTLIDDATSAFGEVNMTAELYGMFFVAEDVFGGETAGRPLELTCYRRNLWQCSGQITMPRHCTQAINEHGLPVPIIEFYASISAIESIEGKSAEIISIPWKSNNPALGEGQETKSASAPPRFLLDVAGGQEVDAHRVSVPISWKRLQFKSATANNGRRKGLQQHYVVQIQLLGRSKAGGELLRIAEISSGPVIVRGRSPRNFDSRKDVPLSGEKKPSGAERTRTQSEASITTNLKIEKPDTTPTLNRYTSIGNSGSSANAANDWSAPSTASYGQPPTKKMAISPNLARPPVPAWGRDSSSASKTTSLSGQSKASSGAPSLPINLSLSEDERSPNNRSTTDSLQSPQLGKSGAGLGQNSSPPGEDELLYEYFPLSVDDWTPLVDTIYRPHIVHHIALPQEIKAQQTRSKAKRYFSAD